MTENDHLLSVSASNLRLYFGFVFCFHCMPSRETPHKFAVANSNTFLNSLHCSLTTSGYLFFLFCFILKNIPLWELSSTCARTHTQIGSELSSNKISILSILFPFSSNRFSSFSFLKKVIIFNNKDF